MTTAAGDVFYDDMAEMVVSMLEEFGVPVTIRRYATAFDSTTQKAVRTQTAANTVNACFTNQRKMPLSGTRIETNQRIMVLDGTAAPRMKDTISFPSDYTPTSGGALPGCAIASDYTAEWVIEEVVTIAPANQPLAYMVRVGK